MSAEEQKAAGVEEGISATKATTLGVLTGGAEKGSMFSESLGIEKGSAGDEAMGIAGAAGRGALTGAGIGVIYTYNRNRYWSCSRWSNRGYIRNI